ncbi:MAG: CarD family transcriptional regulator [Ruminococcus sp.]|uniref:CarD family transcriptional regulator n=1 Tax=Ruminococcus sp. TaxID=41978 RepID=UPI0025F9C807|nr:CarD family transcriptional regulator [Ruminococcus sp.]MCR5600803.1 CarD family transcriptional regulator [Ruminococcus sp.]
MYNVDDVVMYGTFGICKIIAVEKRNFTGEEQEYFILRPVNSDKNAFYVPTENKAALSKLHSVCSKTEADELISHMNSDELIWIDNDIKRKEEYSRILKEADHHELIMLIKTLYLRRKELNAVGKKLRSADENYLNLAENMLFEEFAYALDIDRGEVVDYIEKHIA